MSHLALTSLNAAVLAVGLLLAADQPGFADDAKSSPQAAVPTTQMTGWSRQKDVQEIGSQAIARWAATPHDACTTTPPITSVDEATLSQLRVVGKCEDGEKVLMFSRAKRPAALPGESCDFDYVTLDGLIPAYFEDVTPQYAKDAEMLTELRGVVPGIRRIYDGPLGDSVAIILFGAKKSSIDYSRFSISQLRKELTDEAARRSKNDPPGTSAQYHVTKDLPISLLVSLDYEIDGKPRHTFEMDVIANRHCIVTFHLEVGDEIYIDKNWRSMQYEFQRVRDVIEKHEGPVPFAKE